MTAPPPLSRRRLPGRAHLCIPLSPHTVMSRLLVIAAAVSLTALVGASSSPSTTASLPSDLTFESEVTRWVLDPGHSTVGFGIQYVGQNEVGGSFDDFSAELTFDYENPSQNRVQATVQTFSVDTGVPLRDFHLRRAEWFDVDQHPEMTFASTRWTRVEGGYTVAGELSLRGVTRPVTLDVKAFGVTEDMEGGERAAFHGTTVVDREAFGVGPVGQLPSGAEIVATDVRVDLSLSLVPAPGQ